MWVNQPRLVGVDTLILVCELLPEKVSLVFDEDGGGGRLTAGLPTGTPKVGGVGESIK